MRAFLGMLGLNQKMQTTVDYLIVGQGIAGTLTAYELWERGCSVLVVDDAPAELASRAALGIINPVIGIRFNLTWRYPQSWEAAREVYGRLENRWGVKLLHEMPVMRIFRDSIEALRWGKRWDGGDSTLRARVAQVYGPELTDGLGAVYHPRHGAVEFHGGGWVDLDLLLEKARGELSAQGLLRKGKVETGDLQFQDDGPKAVWEKGGVRAERGVIFCEGFRAEKNSFFDWLPAKSARGESLVVRMPELPRNRIIIHGIFLLPMGEDANNPVRVGATWRWDNLFEDKLAPSEACREELISELRALVKIPCEIQEQRVGVRPIVKGQKPVAGTLPGKPGVGINGFYGSKGAICAPLCSRFLADHLLDGKPLPEDVDVRRNF